MHEIASKRMGEIETARAERTIELKKLRVGKKKRETVEVTMEDDEEESTRVPIEAEEN